MTLRFVEGKAALVPGVAEVFEWPARTTWECPNTRLRVFGLPSPSDESLQGRRAHSVAQVLRGFGIPEPLFELGDAEDQAQPGLEILAQP